MSQRRPAPLKAPAPPPPPPSDDEEEDEELEEYPDMFEALASLLATEDGDTIATILSETKNATERIAMQLEMQNKILVKILTELKPKTVPSETKEEEP
jgi:hypothetical protein